MSEITQPFYRNSQLSHSDVMRYSDFPRNAIVEEYVALWKSHIPNWIELDLSNSGEDSVKHSDIPSPLINKELQMKIFWYLHDVETSKNYTKLEIEKIDDTYWERWDIIIINFIKYNIANPINITLKILVKTTDRIKISWYAVINDEETSLHSKLIDENITLPIIKSGERGIIFEKWIKIDTLIKILSSNLHESKIRDITLYKKNGNQKWIQKIKWLWDLIKSTVWTLIWKK